MQSHYEFDEENSTQGNQIIVRFVFKITDDLLKPFRQYDPIYRVALMYNATPKSSKEWMSQVFIRKSWVNNNNSDFCLRRGHQLYMGIKVSYTDH